MRASSDSSTSGARKHGLQRRDMPLPRGTRRRWVSLYSYICIQSTIHLLPGCMPRLVAEGTRSRAELLCGHTDTRRQHRDSVYTVTDTEHAGGAALSKLCGVAPSRVAHLSTPISLHKALTEALTAARGCFSAILYTGAVVTQFCTLLCGHLHKHTTVGGRSKVRTAPYHLP